MLYKILPFSYLFKYSVAQCLTNLTIDSGYVMFSGDSKLVGYRCYEGFRLIGSATAKCMENGTWSSPPPECTGMT